MDIPRYHGIEVNISKKKKSLAMIIKSYVPRYFLRTKGFLPRKIRDIIVHPIERNKICAPPHGKHLDELQSAGCPDKKWLYPRIASVKND